MPSTEKKTSGATARSSSKAATSGRKKTELRAFDPLRVSTALQTPNNGVSATEFTVACAVFRFTDNDLGRTFGDAEYERRRGTGEKRYPSAYVPEIAARAKRSVRTISRVLASLQAKGWWTVLQTGRALVITWTTKWKEIYAQQRRGPLLSMPRTRISETNHAPAAGASAAPSSAPAMRQNAPGAPVAPLELPPELERLPGALEPADVFEIVRGEHQDAVHVRHRAVREGKQTSSLVPKSPEILEWCLALGALAAAAAAAADDTRSAAVRRGVAVGVQIYTKLQGHKSKTLGDLNEEAHPGMWLPRYLEQIKLLVRDHFAPQTPTTRAAALVSTTPPTPEQTLAAARQAKQHVEELARGVGMIAVGGGRRR